MCEQYHVSRITLRHAISDLIQEDLLIREQGRGTFRSTMVSDNEHKVISDHVSGFYRQQADLGNKVMAQVLYHDFSDGSLYDFLRNIYAVRLVENALVIRMQQVFGKMSEYFPIPDGSRVLAMDSTVIDELGSVIAFGMALNAPENSKVKFIIRANKEWGTIPQ